MGVAERRQREKESRTESIKKNAAKLFARKGFHNVSMAEIAEAAEVSKGTLYIYFKSKEELYFSLIEPILTRASQVDRQDRERRCRTGGPNP